MIRKVIALGVALAIPALIAGCGASTDPAAARNPDRKPTATTTDQHAHKAGGHGGLVVEIGQRDSYHAEIVLEKEGVVRIYTLDKDEGKILEVDRQQLTAYAKAEGAMESVQVNFEAAPLPDDPAGKTSQFLGKLPKEFWGRPVTVTVPIRIADYRYRFNFTFARDGHAEMPVGSTDDAERRKLYLTAGGIYTDQDIEANGKVTAWQKYAGFRSKHEDPKVGEKICPVSETKANDKLTWIVGGKKYEFCCPPCIDEFVTWAKEEPGKVKEPGEYIKK